MIGIIMSGAFISFTNQTVISPMLPSIMAEFRISMAVAQWLSTIFLLLNGLMVPITAYLISRFSTRQIYLMSVSMFVVGTVICAFSGSFVALLLGRVVQAVGAGVLTPFFTYVMMMIFPRERRGFALGIGFVVIGAGPAFGPTIAGWVTDVFGWRFVFHAIWPIAVVDVVFAVFLLRNLQGGKKISLDWNSVLLSVFSFGGLLFGFSIAGVNGWAHPTCWGSIIVGGVFLYFYAKRQFALEHPLLNLKLLKDRVFSSATILFSVGQLGMTVGVIITPIFLQNAHGETAMVAGLTLMPAAIAMAALNPVSGVIFDKFGPRVIVITGFSMITVGTVIMATIDMDTPLSFIVVIYTMRMGGMAFVNLALNAWGLNALKNDVIAHGNAIINTSSMMAAAIGTAILVTIMTMVQQADPAGGVVALTHGVNAAFATAAVLNAVGLVLAIIKVGRGGKN
jgi:EmrB/QacA subfamily drug resistance transporter